ncbi:MAG: response regulator [Thermodesulfobacteriota bacterium]|nr:response regulator [Thermodesulfobacteriota bacterium]
MFGFIDYIQRSLSTKIFLALTIGVAIVMGAIIYLQGAQIKERMKSYGRELKFVIYAGIEHPMAVGDKETVQRQILDIKRILKEAEIIICDFDQRITFATDKNMINKKVSEYIHDKETLSALNELLDTGKPQYEKYFEEEIHGKKYLMTVHRMSNKKQCHHCHGASKKMLGGLIVKQSTDETYAAIASLRNRTILLSVIAIAIIISIIYFLLSRLVIQPVNEMAGKAERLARGDMSVSVEVKAKDSIGILGNSFNYMVESIRDQIEYANSLKGAIVDPLFMVDTNRVITYMNEACVQLTGYSKKEVEGKLTCQDLFKGRVCGTSCPVIKSYDKEKALERIRTTVIDKQGKQIPIMASASALRDAHGNIIGAVEVCKDITDVLEAERLRYIKETANKEEELRKYLEQRVENISGILARVSRGNLKVRAEVLEKNDIMDEIAQHTNLMLDNLEKLYAKISSFSKDLELEVARRTMMLREKTMLLERANRELRELDRLKSAFLANMSHELRTPMNSIIGYTDLLLDRVDGEINEEQEKSLHKVENNAQHLLQLINDILDMAKIESGKIELDLNYADIKELIESVEFTFEQQAIKKGLTFSFDFDENLPQVYIDKDKIKQVLINLLTNAVKFTYQGCITTTVKPSGHGIKPGDSPLFLEVCVEDTGIGIKKEDIDKLFDKFSQIDVSTIRQYEGTGLGLSIARGIVVLHKGVIWAESEFGKGSKFIFTLPLKKELLEKPEKPLLESMMAQGLAKCFNKPVEAFMKGPKYAGKPIRCWEYFHCGQTSCPTYGGTDLRCWLIHGTHNKGTEIATYPNKVDFCKGCEIMERLILGEYESDDAGILTKDGEFVVETDKKTVLAIDDNPETIEIIQKYLGNDYYVLGLLSGARALEEAKKIKPIAITLDILMPKKDGWQVLQDLKKSPETQDIPVIILSIVDNKKLGFSLGAAEYIVKPIDKNVLLQKLKYLEKIAMIKKVLVVDNDPRTVELIGQVLNEAGYKTTTADNSEDAIKAIEDSRPDMIILNLIITEVKGFDLVEYIKTEEEIKNIPLIIISEKDLSKKELQDLDGRVQVILNKGILSEEELLEELKDIISKSNK